MASCRDCPSYLASAETVRDLLLPAETAVHEKWLPAETVRDLLFPADRQTSYDSVVLVDDTGVIRALPIDGDQ